MCKRYLTFNIHTDKMNALYLYTDGDTTIPLAETLEIEKYGCAVIDLYGKVDKKFAGQTLYLCADFVQDVFVESIKLRALRHFVVKSNSFVSEEIYNPIWLPITRRPISCVRLYICDSQGEIQSVGSRGLRCTLLLVPNRYG